MVSAVILCNRIVLTFVVPRLEIATLNRADSDLEACRTQISKDIIALLLKNLTSSGHLSPQGARRMDAIFQKQFLWLEKEIQEEYDRKMVALTAECDLDTRKKTESQYQREMAAMEEAEEVLKRGSERVRRLPLPLPFLLGVHHLSIHLAIHPSGHPSSPPTTLPVCLFIRHPSMHPSIQPQPIRPCTCHSPIHLSVRPSIHPSRNHLERSHLVWAVKVQRTWFLHPSS